MQFCQHLLAPLGVKLTPSRKRRKNSRGDLRIQPIQSQNLIREIDGGSTAVVARNLTQVQFTYFDNAVPPVQFAPATLAEQLTIRVIEARLDVATEGPRLAGDGLPTITLTTRVTPRSLVLF